MAISAQAPTAASELRLQRPAADRAGQPSRLLKTVNLLKRLGERVSSAIFDADGDIWRL